MLKLENLKFNIANKQILDNFNLEIKDGEIYAIMGPNGIGKSTLTKIIMAHPDYKLESGKIYFDDNLINDKEVDEIAKMGIFVSFQNPIEIDGVTNNDFLLNIFNNLSYFPIKLSIEAVINSSLFAVLKSKSIPFILDTSSINSLTTLPFPSLKGCKAFKSE